MLNRQQIQEALLLLTPRKEIYFKTSSQWEAKTIEKLVKSLIKSGNLPYSYSIQSYYNQTELKWVVRVACLEPVEIYLKDEEGNYFRIGGEEK